MAQKALNRRGARVFRPLVEEPLWSRGIKAVGAGKIEWDRLRERYLDDEFDEFRPGRDRFLVVECDEPYTPKRRSSQVSPPSSIEASSPIKPLPESPAFHFDDRQTAILERATTAWINRTEATSPAGGRYVAALRAARHDVDRLRAARTVAGVLEDGDVRRIVRRFRSWRTSSSRLEARAAFARRCRGAVVRRRCVEAFSLLKEHAASVRASRRGAAAALCVAALRRGVRRQTRAAFRCLRAASASTNNQQRALRHLARSSAAKHCAMAWRTWMRAAFRLTGAASTQARALRRLALSSAGKRRAMAWRSWLLVVRRGTVLKRVAAMVQREAARAKLRAWRAAASRSSMIEDRASALRRRVAATVSRRRKRRALAAIFDFARRNSTLRHVAATLGGVLGRTRRRRLARALSSLKTVGAALDQRKRTLRRVAARLAHGRALLAYQAWRRRATLESRCTQALQRVFRNTATINVRAAFFLLNRNARRVGEQRLGLVFCAAALERTREQRLRRALAKLSKNAAGLRAATSVALCVLASTRAKRDAASILCRGALRRTATSLLRRGLAAFVKQAAAAQQLCATASRKQAGAVFCTAMVRRTANTQMKSALVRLRSHTDRCDRRVRSLRRVLGIARDAALRTAVWSWRANVGVVGVLAKQILNHEIAARYLGVVSRASKRNSTKRAWRRWSCTAARLTGRNRLVCALAQDRRSRSAFTAWRSSVQDDRSKRLGAFVGVLVGTAARHAKGRGLRRCFRELKMRQRRGGAARRVLLLFATALESRVERAFDAWARDASSQKRRAGLRRRLEGRLLGRAWVRWRSHVEVDRELRLLQRGVRALARPRMLVAD